MNRGGGVTLAYGCLWSFINIPLKSSQGTKSACAKPCGYQQHWGCSDESMLLVCGVLAHANIALSTSPVGLFGLPKRNRASYFVLDRTFCLICPLVSLLCAPQTTPDKIILLTQCNVWKAPQNCDDLKGGNDSHNDSSGGGGGLEVTVGEPRKRCFYGSRGHGVKSRCDGKRLCLMAKSGAATWKGLHWPRKKFCLIPLVTITDVC